MPVGAPAPGDQGGDPPERLDRRRFLQVAGGALGAAASGVLAGTPAGASTANHGGKRQRSGRAGRRPAVSSTTLASGVVVPTARWLIEENQRPGTTAWIVTGIQTPHAIEGFASQVSAVAGDEVHVFVNSTARSMHVEAYRMGWYQGTGGRLVHRTPTISVGAQPAPTFTSGVNTVECAWQPTLTLAVDDSWPPGCYLLKLVGDGGEQQYVPLTVRDDASTAAYLLQNSVTTWQAYNLWGGYSLYYGQTPSGGQDFANRARIVSFDRPYPQSWAQGCADFLGNEFPVLYQMEQLGLDMTYWTDVDFHRTPTRLLRHKAMFSLGHDEYWSLEMRDGALAAVAKGVNLGFLGANACYRQIRLQPSPVGPDRLEVCYKDAAADPMMGVDDAVVTGPEWDSPPTNWPESILIGSMYQSVGADDDLVIVDAGHWLLDGCPVRNGQHLAKVVQGEYDRYVPSLPGPTDVDVVAHSPVAGQGNWSDITYYTSSGGGGVVDTGMASFVNKLSNTTAFPSNVVPAPLPGITDILLRMMENVYGTFGHGPAANIHESTGNWRTVYQGAAADAPSAPSTPSA
jgi:hypothetical protein